MTEKQFKLFVGKNYGVQKVDGEVIFDSIISMAEADVLVDLLNDLSEENEQLKKGMIKVVDRYIKNVDCNPPSSAHTYMKIKRALVNIREDLKDLIEDLE